MQFDIKWVKSIIKLALAEDRASDDITSQGLRLGRKTVKAEIISKQSGIVCGLALLKPIFEVFGKKVKIKTFKKDGDSIKPNEKPAVIEGKCADILAAERTILNFLGRLSGIATLTNSFARAVAGSKAQILDTRKTTPCLRGLEKYAVKCGGGKNHRMSLADLVLVKDNHIARSTFGQLKRAFRTWRKKGYKIEIEAENMRDVKKFLLLKPDIIMLDNFSAADTRSATAYIKKHRGNSKKPLIEVSGNINIHNARKLAGYGVDRISVGRITHSAENFDFSIEIE